LSVDEVGQLLVWDVDKPKSRPVSIKAHEESINKLVPFPAHTSSSHCCVTASDDNTLRVWDIESEAKLVRVLQGHNSYVTSCDIEKDGRIIGVLFCIYTSAHTDSLTFSLLLILVIFSYVRVKQSRFYREIVAHQYRTSCFFIAHTPPCLFCVFFTGALLSVGYCSHR
jgi:WD40 repeat protein